MKLRYENKDANIDGNRSLEDLLDLVYENANVSR